MASAVTSMSSVHFWHSGGADVAESREAALLRVLLSARSLDELDPLIRTAMPFDARSLLQDLSAREQAALIAGRTAETAYVAYLRPLIEEVLSDYRLIPSDDVSIDGFEPWLDHALALPSLFSMFLAARRCRSVLGADAFGRAREAILGTGWQPATDQHVTALVAVAFAVGGSWDRVIARLFWAIRCGKTGRPDRAWRHVSKARAELESVVDDIGDDERQFAYFLLGGSAQACRQLDLAIDAYQTALAGEPEKPNPATRIALATCLADTGRGEEATTVLSEIDFASSAPEPEVGLHMRAINLRAELHEESEEYDLALSDHETVVAMARYLGDRRSEFRARVSVTRLLSQAGRHRDAVHAAGNNLVQARTWSDHLSLASAHNNLGAALLAKGDKAAAREQYRAALECRTGADGPTFSEAVTHFGLGDTELDDEESANLFHRVGFMHAEHATDTLTALTHYLPRVRRPDNTLPEDVYRGLLQPALGRAIREGNWPAYTLLTDLFADHLAATGQCDVAIGVRREVLGNWESRGSRQAGMIECRTKLAELLVAAPESRQEAFDLLWKSRTLILEKVGQALVEQRHSEILGAHIRVYDLLIQLLVHTDTRLELPDARRRNELAFDLHEEAKSRSFLIGMSRHPPHTDEPLPIDLLEHEAELILAERRLQRSQWTAGARRRGERLARLAEVRAELSAIWERLRPLAPEYVRVRQALPTDLHQVRELLGQHAPAGGMALVSYFVGRDETTCFILRSDDEELRVCRVSLTEAKLGAVAERLRVTFNGDPESFPPVAPLRGRHPHRRSIAFLDDIGPELLSFTAHTAGLPLVYLAPHGPVHLLPLHALPIADQTRLVEVAATVYCPSLSSLPAVLARRQSDDAQQGEAFVAGVAAREDLVPENFERDQDLLTVEGRPPRSVVGIDATPSTVLAGIANARIAHLTCHGSIDRSEPLESGLLLAHDGVRPSNDPRRSGLEQRRGHVLSVGELADIETSLRLLVLRACSAGSLARENSGDEFSGLVRTFLQSGVSAVIAPTWNVDQESSRWFLAELYDGWRMHPTMPLWLLFHRTQLRMLRGETDPWTTHPYHWAPFVLVGDWR
ncbi:CHAT domain-containing tetratricopeptide repeat protein [Amycolatopsis sp. WAC 01375]|uniref:CHAT domain-containing protein n=1 Tax=Amycolatopsis sp. WAC 01375 TaxID=2203194 RepID=UPI00131575DB|nr:CHAT domain-containing tetratricopeptide repeat protein [Amycolatopsis sp. WAC 01375]